MKNLAISCVLLAVFVIGFATMGAVIPENVQNNYNEIHAYKNY